MRYWVLIAAMTAAGACLLFAACRFTTDPLAVSAGLTVFAFGVLIRATFDRWRTTRTPKESAA